MKKLILLFISLLAVGAAFQSCDNTKTYAEMLEEERDGRSTMIHSIGTHCSDRMELSVATE